MGRGDPRAPATILGQPAFAPYDGGEMSPGPAVETDEQILDWVARDAETALHPSCTCAHGHRRRRSSTRRRCASTASTGCASSTRRSFPYVTNGNIYAPVMMVAEKAADLIRGDTPLPAEPVDFYRHDAVRSG